MQAATTGMALLDLPTLIAIPVEIVMTEVVVEMVNSPGQATMNTIQVGMVIQPVVLAVAEIGIVAVVQVEFVVGISASK